MRKIDFASRLRTFVAECNSEAIAVLLDEISLFEKIPVRQFLRIHDALLFAMAYPPNAEIRRRCEDVLFAILNNKKQARKNLNDSGIFNSTLVSSYSLELVTWLQKNYPDAIQFHSFGQDTMDWGESLQLLFPDAESEVLTSGWSKNKLFRFLCGRRITTEKLIRLFHSSSNPTLAGHLFAKAQVYVTLDFSKNLISRTQARSISYPVFFHSSIVKKPDTQQIIHSPLPKAVPIRENQKEFLVTHARMMLASLGRETDPVTSCAVNETEFYYLDRGFAIALFYLRPQNRLAFDAYVGYMMYKNGLPIAYGGAWIFLDKALLGINIFEVYRGGESAVLFAQLLRCYSKRFGINVFTVEPYQYGKNNPEGIHSGAYWFYYRFGFRSDNTQLSKIAEEEHQKIIKNKNYKTPTRILKKFTQSTISLELKPSAFLTTSELSTRITRYITTHYLGNREKAILAGEKKLRKYFGKINMGKSAEFKKVWQNWCLIFMVVDAGRFPNSKEKATFQKMIIEKSEKSESNYLIERSEEHTSELQSH